MEAKKKSFGYAKARNGVKRCSACQEYKPIEQFGKNKRANDGYQNACKSCKHDYWNRWHQKNYTDPVYRRRLNDNQIRVALNRALRKYGLTMEEYEALVAQGCGVCGGPPNGRGRFHFDHDHDSNQFRGLLCSHCNTALGLLKDDPDILDRAKEYLLKSRKLKVVA